MKHGPVITLCVALLLLFSCFGTKEASLDGHWRAVWMSQAGEVPGDFFFETAEDGTLKGEIHNAAEVLKFSRIEKEGNHINLYNDRFESLISADIAEDRLSMSGKWSKQVGLPVEMPFQAFKGDMDRFPVDKYPPLEGTAPIQDISGTWKYIWEEYDPEGYLVMTISQEGERVTASVRSAIGDWRWLEGIYRNGRLELSLFNGTWVFLISAKMDENGTFHGIWVKSSNPPNKWYATKEDIDLPDTFKLSRITSEDGSFRFEFPSADDPETMISNEDPRFKVKPYVLALTTTGCPNGHDNAELLSKLYKDYKDKGLHMLFINYEMTKDLDLTLTRIKRFRKLFDLPFPIAYSMAMNKKECGDELPDLERFIAWPTTLFIGTDGKVKAVHTGMSGPGTGKHYLRLEERYRAAIESLL